MMVQIFRREGDVYKSIGIMLLLALGLAMPGCGSSSGSTNINGNWSASLTNSPTGPTIYAFTTTFTETGGGGLRITNFTFTSSNGSCFIWATTQTGSFTLTGNLTRGLKSTFCVPSTVQPPGSDNRSCPP